MHFYDGPQRIIQEMIDAARVLEVFDSYKLWLKPAEDEKCRSLRFYSPLLMSLNLHRADGLKQLTIWAPRLVELVLKACCELQDINFVPPPGWLLDSMGATDKQRRMWNNPYGPDHVEVLRALGLPVNVETVSSKPPVVPLRVDVANAFLGVRALSALQKHPRIDQRDLAKIPIPNTF